MRAKLPSGAVTGGCCTGRCCFWLYIVLRIRAMLLIIGGCWSRHVNGWRNSRAAERCCDWWWSSAKLSDGAVDRKLYLRRLLTD